MDQSHASTLTTTTSPGGRIVRAIAGNRRLPTGEYYATTTHPPQRKQELQQQQHFPHSTAAASHSDDEEEEKDDRTAYENVARGRSSSGSPTGEEGHPPAKKKSKPNSSKASSTLDSQRQQQQQQQQQHKQQDRQALAQLVGSEFLEMSDKARQAIHKYKYRSQWERLVAQKDPALWEWIQCQITDLQQGRITSPHKLQILRDMNFPGAATKSTSDSAASTKQPPTLTAAVNHHSPARARKILASASASTTTTTTTNNHHPPRVFTTNTTLDFRDNATEFITTSVSLLDRKTVSKREHKWIARYKELRDKLQQHRFLTAPAILQDVPLQKWIDQQRKLWKEPDDSNPDNDNDDTHDQPPPLPDERVRLLKLLVPHFFVSKHHFAGGGALPEFAMGVTSLLERTNLKSREAEWVQQYKKLQELVEEYKRQQQQADETTKQGEQLTRDGSTTASSPPPKKSSPPSSLLDIPSIEQDEPLRIWLQAQKALWMDTGFTTMPQDERVRLLCELSPTFFRPSINHSRRQDQWMHCYYQLADAIHRHGGVLDEVALKKELPHLDVWIRRQRSAYNSKDRTLKRERVDLLNKLNFTWNATGFETKWMARYHELLVYKDLFGHTNVPDSKNSKWSKLGYWVHAQRQAFRAKAEGREISRNTLLTEERLRLLRDIDFDFSRKQDPKDWSYRFNELVEYKRMHGDTMVPKRYINTQLARWVTSMRRNYTLMLENKPHSLTDEKIQQLESIGFVWRVRDFRPISAKRHKEFATEDEAREKEAQSIANLARKEAKTALFQTRELEKQAEEILNQARQKRAEYEELDAKAKELEKRALEISMNASQNNQGAKRTRIEDELFAADSTKADSEVGGGYNEGE